jgi:predicted ArsR family transcriptional regulator
MSQARPNSRFAESTRGRIVDLLRRSSQTVDELAKALNVTDNAIRLQLSILERDGIVRSRGVRREGTVGKPAVLYDIAPSAEPTFSNAYLPFLSTLLDALGDRLSAAELRALMRDVGRRLAASSNAEATAKTPAEIAMQALGELGGLAEIESSGKEATTIRGFGCPLSVAVCEQEEVCLAVQTMLTELTGRTVREHCDRSGERPRCCFEVG